VNACQILSIYNAGYPLGESDNHQRQMSPATKPLEMITQKEREVEKRFPGTQSTSPPRPPTTVVQLQGTIPSHLSRLGSAPNMPKSNVHQRLNPRALLHGLVGAEKRTDVARFKQCGDSLAHFELCEWLGSAV
jgi:hypothetical protein